MAATPFPFLCWNPHQPTQIWMIAYNTRRWVLGDEWALWSYVGCTVSTVSAQFFDSIPVATG